MLERWEGALEEQNRDMKNLLEDLLTQIQKLHEEFVSVLDILERL